MGTQEQIDDLMGEVVRRPDRYRDLVVTSRGLGSYSVELQVHLPRGWNAEWASVYFLVPVGYPFNRPRKFITAGNLRLEHGGHPVATESVKGGTRWSWSSTVWNERYDTLVTFVNLIRRRFEQQR